MNFYVFQISIHNFDNYDLANCDSVKFFKVSSATGDVSNYWKQ